MSMIIDGSNGVTFPDASTQAVSALDYGPAFSAYRNTTAQSVTSGVPTKIQFNTEEFDTHSAYDSVTNYRFQPSVAGYYQLNGTLTPNGTSLTIIEIDIYKNGSSYRRGAYSPNGGSSLVSAVVYLNGSTDYAEMWGVVTGTSPTFYNGVVYTSFSGVLVRAA